MNLFIDLSIQFFLFFIQFISMTQFYSSFHIIIILFTDFTLLFFFLNSLLVYAFEMMFNWVASAWDAHRVFVINTIFSFSFAMKNDDINLHLINSLVFFSLISFFLIITWEWLALTFRVCNGLKRNRMYSKSFIETFDVLQSALMKNILHFFSRTEWNWLKFYHFFFVVFLGWNNDNCLVECKNRNDLLLSVFKLPFGFISSSSTSTFTLAFASNEGTKTLPLSPKEKKENLKQSFFVGNNHCLDRQDAITK